MAKSTIAAVQPRLGWRPRWHPHGRYGMSTPASPTRPCSVLKTSWDEGKGSATVAPARDGERELSPARYRATGPACFSTQRSSASTSKECNKAVSGDYLRRQSIQIDSNKAFDQRGIRRDAELIVKPFRQRAEALGRLVPISLRQMGSDESFGSGLP